MRDVRGAPGLTPTASLSKHASMRDSTILLAVLSLLVGAVGAAAQAPVVASPNPEALFTDTDPRLHANKLI